MQVVSILLFVKFVNASNPNEHMKFIFKAGVLFFLFLFCLILDWFEIS